jgi:hypothetical protein
MTLENTKCERLFDLKYALLTLPMGSVSFLVLRPPANGKKPSIGRIQNSSIQKTEGPKNPM